MSDLIKTPKKIYVNIDKYNTNTQRLDNVIELNNSTTILDNIMDYECFIERAELPIDLVPIMNIQPNTYLLTFVNSNTETTYDLYNYIPVIDQNNMVYDINVIVSAMNRMLSEATSDTTSNVVNICVKYDPTTKFFTYLINSDFLIALNGTYSNTNVFTSNTKWLYFNENLYELFGIGFNSKSSNYLATKAFEMHFTYYDNYLQQNTLMYTHDSIVDSNFTLIKFIQYKQSIANFFNVCHKIVMITDMPIEGEYLKLGTESNKTSYLTQKILTDIVLEPSELTSFDQLIYLPTHRRYINFTNTNVGLKNIRIEFYYQGYDSKLYPIEMPNNSSIGVKLCFVNRNWQI